MIRAQSAELDPIKRKATGRGKWTLKILNDVSAVRGCGLEPDIPRLEDGA